MPGSFNYYYSQCFFVKIEHAGCCVLVLRWYKIIQVMFCYRVTQSIVCIESYLVGISYAFYLYIFCHIIVRVTLEKSFLTGCKLRQIRKFNK